VPETRSAPPARRSKPDILVLVRCRAVQLRNALDQQLRDAPVRTFVVLLLLVTIWVALYLLLKTVFEQVGRWELVAVVADKQIFLHFFLVLAVMLAFSNAVLAFSSLFGRDEAAHLLAMPLRPRHVLSVKWLEGMLLSSWSFILLGVPLMFAVAHNTTVRWYYYPLFIGHFLGFVLMPATVGLVAAWAIAMWVPRRPLILLLWIGGAVLAGGVYYLWRVSREALEAEQWLELLLREVAITRNKFLPSTWTAEGIVAAIERRTADSLMYLFVVLGNAAFFAWVAINLLGRTWAEAYNRARQGRARADIRTAWLTAAVCDVLFFYLPVRLRRITLKDLRGFARDATQWTQMVIMLGLLVIYALNLKRFPVDLGRPEMKTLIVFLNLVIISLILATFTCRFVYPLLSLESQQLWLLSLLPLRRSTLLLIKFLFALTVTGLSGVGVMTLAVTVLELPPAWAVLNLALCFGVCVGLSGLSVGLGARFPVLGQRNPARIASGVGGTVNLIASMLFVAVQMAGAAFLGLSELSRDAGSPAALETLSNHGWRLAVGLLLFSGLTAAAALWSGARHFDRLEC
jgi:ABC-2 type transport system permease protein